MSVDKATVAKIASLARIGMSDAELDQPVPELNNILGWVDQLGEVDVAGVEPMTAVVATEMKKRADIVTEGERAEAVTANAPVREGHFFVVPKVVE